MNGSVHGGAAGTADLAVEHRRGGGAAGILRRVEHRQRTRIREMPLEPSEASVHLAQTAIRLAISGRVQVVVAAYESGLVQPGVDD